MPGETVAANIVAVWCYAVALRLGGESVGAGDRVRAVRAAGEGLTHVSWR